VFLQEVLVKVSSQTGMLPWSTIEFFLTALFVTPQRTMSTSNLECIASPGALIYVC
jgi:hypothetical protein